MNISVDKIFQELGRMHLENQALRDQLAEAQARIAALTPALQPAEQAQAAK